MEHFNRLRRSSFTPSFGFGSATTVTTPPNNSNPPKNLPATASTSSHHHPQLHHHATAAEPMIVVEETGADDDVALELASLKSSTPRESLDIDSPVNPYLLSPWRDARETRKHSLPTQQVTDGITASQVRRLSERGGEGSGPTPKEAAFLATLSQAPQPSGRRHSVVTISKVPQTVFGRCRRESVAAYPMGSRGSLFSSRRDSTASTAAAAAAAVGPPATDPAGSIHNLQLDIMDDIVQARKARMKLWNTSSEKVCEVQTVDEAGTSSPKRYTNRRYSDFVGSTLAPIPSNRRASENMMTPAVAAAVAAQASAGASSPGSSMASNFFKKSGIVVTKNDLLSLMSSLTSSANEINRLGNDEPVPPPLTAFASKTPATGAAGSTPPAASTSTASGNSLMPEPMATRSTRSNSFDVSILHNAKQLIGGGSGGAAAGNTAAEKNAAALSGWFEKRHQPMARKKSMRPSCAATVSFSKDVLDRFKDKEADAGKEAAAPREKKSRSRLRWDNKGSFVDPHIIGNAIEGFLRKSSGRSTKESRARKASGGGSGSGAGSSARASFWFGKGDEDDSKDSCDQSLCATLKDLFVK